MKAMTVVVGYDGSSNAKRALDAAITALADDGVVHIVTAYDAPSVSEINRALQSLPDEFRDTYDPASQYSGYLTEAEIHCRSEGATTRTHLVDDHPAKAILEVADQVGADLIVVGSRGLGRVTGFIRGSVSSRIADHAATSVLIVHEA